MIDVDWLWHLMFLHTALSRKSDAPGTSWAAKVKVLCFTATSSCVARRLASLWCCRRHSPAKCTALLLMSSEPWWTMWTQIWWNLYSQLCSVHSVWIYLMRLLLHYIIALQFDHQIGDDWRRLRLDLSRGNIPESCVDMRGGVSFLVFLLPRALQRLSDYPPSQMLDGFCLPFLRSHFRPCLSTFRSILAKMSWVVLGIRLRCWPVEVDLYNIWLSYAYPCYPQWLMDAHVM